MIERQKRITKMLKEKNIRPSYTRIKICDYLYKDKVHPNVDGIYKELLDEMPTLSKTTVYNTLKLFTEKGLARSINVYDNEMRYEAMRNDHGHFKCNKCEQIYDIPIDMEIKLPNYMEGSTIDEKQFTITGICNRCN